MSTVCCKVVFAKQFYLKGNLRSIHVFSLEIILLKKEVLVLKINKMLKYDLLNHKEPFFIKQKGLCGLCHEQMANNEKSRFALYTANK